MTHKLTELVANMKEEEALNLTQKMLDGGEDPVKILELCKNAMGIVGETFEKGEYFIPELIMAGEIMQKVADLVKPRMKKAAEAKTLGKFVIGTVEGDIHDIGKNIVTFMLDVNGIQVHDLGVDVSPQQFIEKIREVQPQIVGLSGLLTLAIEQMKKTVRAIKDADLKDKVKVMVGGAPVNQEVAEYVGADAYRPDAVAAVSLAKEWLGGKQK